MRVGLIGTGEMGSAVGACLAAAGFDVVTSLAGRSAASTQRIARAGVRAVDGPGEVVAGSRLVLSIVPPGEAVGVAEGYAPALAQAGGATAFVDCNAISPDTMVRVAAIVGATGAPCIDAGIVGGPPHAGYSPTFYASGPQAALLCELEPAGLRVRLLGDALGRASAMKMCYAGITKGFTALGYAMRSAAERHGLADELARECGESQPALTAWLDRQLPAMPRKAYRWVAEMHEIGRATGDPDADAIYRAIAAEYATIAGRFRPA